MKKEITLLGAIVLALIIIAVIFTLFISANKPARNRNLGINPFSPSTRPANVHLRSFPDSLSYALGYIYGSDIADIDFNFNLNIMFSGLVNAQDPTIEILTEEQIMDLFERFHTQMAALRVAEDEQLAWDNQQEGIRFMAQNAHDPQVVTTPSGIQYKVLRAGNGQRVRSNDIVTVHYTAKFLDGTVFQSTHEREEPTTFRISDVIPGWYEGLKLMSVGDIYEIVMPDSLAYGDRGYNFIEPGAYLIFETEVLSIGL
jgi:FKBP-type peptidyl-prolyl cis-trans isomerase FklB